MQQSAELERGSFQLPALRHMSTRRPTPIITFCGSLISAIIFCASMHSATAADQSHPGDPVEITSKEFFQMENNPKSKAFAYACFQGILTGLWWYNSQMEGDRLFCPRFPLTRDQSSVITRSYVQRRFAGDWEIGLMAVEGLKEAFPCHK